MRVPEDGSSHGLRKEVEEVRPREKSISGGQPFVRLKGGPGTVLDCVQGGIGEFDEDGRRRMIWE